MPFSEVIENLKSKNSVLMMKLTGETDKRRQVESQLHSVEVEMEKFKLECVRLQIKNNEYSMKLKQLKEGNVNFLFSYVNLNKCY